MRKQSACSCEDVRDFGEPGSRRCQGEGATSILNLAQGLRLPHLAQRVETSDIDMNHTLEKATS